MLKQYSKEIHKIAKKKYDTRKVITRGIDYIWSADLVDMYDLKDDDYRYLLNIVDVLSKFAWSIPLKNKTGKTIVNELNKLFKEGRKPVKFWCDQGSEFYNKDVMKLFEENDIMIYSSYGKSKSNVVEGFNRTLKTEMWKRFDEQQSNKWVNMIPELLKWYNNKKHSTIGMTPIQASRKENETILLKKQDEKESNKSEGKQLFQVGDKVRISRIKKTFEKGYTHNWSIEIFIVEEVLNTKPITYKIKDENDNIIEGTFYNEELQKTEMGDIYLIEKILKTKTIRGKKKYYVKWLGYTDDYNSWIDENDMKEMNDK